MPGVLSGRTTPGALAAHVLAELQALPPSELSQRWAAAPTPNCMEPAPPTTLPLGALRLPPFGALAERYVDVLVELPVASLLFAEHEDRIRQHPTYARYLEMARAGYEAPPIQVNANLAGQLVSANRRRLMVAQELGLPTLKAWLCPINDETGDPMKYGDLLLAAGLALPDHNDEPPQPAEATPQCTPY